MDYDKEMAEFESMHQGIKDIDYYKAETEAARNGQQAAMEFANAKANEAQEAKNRYDALHGRHRSGWILAGIFFLVSVGLGVLELIVQHWR